MKTLTTPRLTISPFTLEDAPFILELLNDPDWLRFIGDKKVRTLDDARAYLLAGPMAMMAEHGLGLCLVRRRSDGAAIGTCGLIRRDGLDDVDLGFAFLPTARGQGLASEAAAAVLAHGLNQLGLRRIVGITTMDNEASGRVLARVGMRPEGTTQLPGDSQPLQLYGVDAPPTTPGHFMPTGTGPLDAAPAPVAVDLAKAYRLLNHGPTVLVTAEHNGRRNTMAAAWNMPLDFSPPKVAVVIDKATYTRGLIETSGRFMLAVPTRALAALTSAVGGTSGRVADKEAQFGLRYLGPDLAPEAAANEAAGTADTAPTSDPTPPEASLPRVEGCVAWLACRLLPEPHLQQTYDLFLGEVVAAWADPRVFSGGRWHFGGHDALRTLHHVAGGHYFLPGESVDT